MKTVMMIHTSHENRDMYHENRYILFSVHVNNETHEYSRNV